MDDKLCELCGRTEKQCGELTKVLDLEDNKIYEVCSMCAFGIQLTNKRIQEGK